MLVSESSECGDDLGFIHPLIIQEFLNYARGIFEERDKIKK
jgi:hypothetical protein